MTKDSNQTPLALTTKADQIETGGMEECELSASSVIKINQPSSNQAAFNRLAGALSANKTIKTLKIGEITNPEVFAQILRSLETNTSITTLDISGNNALRNFVPLVKLLKNNKNITSLNIDNTHVTMKTLREIFQNNEQIEEIKCGFVQMDSSSASIAGGISDQDGNLIKGFLETNQGRKILKFLEYPNIKIEGVNLDKDLMNMVMKYLVYFNDTLKKEFPSETNPRTTPSPTPAQGQAKAVVTEQIQK
jgi:hypothetical protein